MDDRRLLVAPVARRFRRVASHRPILVLLAAIAMPSPASAQDDRTQILERLVEEGPQRIIVTLDGAFEAAVAAGRGAVASRACDCEVAALPDYAPVKQRALCGLSDFTVVGDVAFLSQVTARVSSVAGLQALLARPEVMWVFLDWLVPTPPGPIVLEPIAPARAAAGAVAFHDAPLFSCAFAPGHTDAVWLRADWNGDGTEDVGKYVPGLDSFLLDANGNGLWDGVLGGDQRVVLVPGRGAGRPLVGDWNGDGHDGVGKWAAGRAFLDADEDGVWRGTAGGDLQSWVPDSLVVGDWDGDGDDELGQYVRPANRFPPGQFPPEPDRFLLDDGDGVWEGHPTDRRVLIASTPLCAGRPLAFDWDPAHPGDGVGKIWGRYTDPDFGHALDLDEDGAWEGNSGGDLLYLGRVVEYCGPLPELF